jgi:hypothetical protein
MSSGGSSWLPGRHVEPSTVVLRIESHRHVHGGVLLMQRQRM